MSWCVNRQPAWSVWAGAIITATGLVAAATWGDTSQPDGVSCRGHDDVDDQEDEDDEELLPLTLDVAKVRPLEGPEHAPAADRPVAPSVAENVACYVCHANYQSEELVAIHAGGGVGCVDCHGKSFEHRNDENNTTPPDVMFPRSEIDPSCAKCHDSHDVPATEVVRRLQERKATIDDDAAPACTDCHGHHRLAHRSVVWDRATGALLSVNSGSPAEDTPAPVADVSGLAGEWVRLGAAGEVAERLAITVHEGQQVHATWELHRPDAPPQVVRLRPAPQNDRRDAGPR